MGISHSLPNESYSGRTNSTFTNSTTCIDVSLPNESYSGRTNITFDISPTCNDARSYVGTYFENSNFKKPIRILELDRRERDDDYLFGFRNGTRNECLSYTPEMELKQECSYTSADMMYLHWKASKCSNSENSTFKKSIRILEQEGREHDDHDLRSWPDFMYLCWKASKCSNSDPFADMSITVVQSSLDLPRLYIKRASHIDLLIDTFSYDQDRLMNISSCSTTRLTSMDDWFEEWRVKWQERNRTTVDLTRSCGTLIRSEIIHNLEQEWSYTSADMMYLHWKASKCSNSDPFADMSITVVQSSLDLLRLYLKRGSHTDLPIDTFSYDQDRLMNISSCSTIRLTSMDDWFEEIASIRKLIHILEQERRKLLDDLCGLANGTRVECRSYTPETSRRMYLHWTASKCSESHSVNSTFKEPIQTLEHDTRECVDDVSFGLGKGTRNECVRSIPENCSRMDLYLTPTKCSESNSDNSTAQESIHILEQETRKCVDDDLIVLENETRNEFLSSTPETYNQMDLHSTPTKCSESNSDLIDDVSKKRRIQYKKRIQSSLEFRRYVKRGSHIVLHREKFSYDHHMLILYVNGNLTLGLEYGFPEGLINIIDTLSETSLGRIQYKTIIIEELFQPNTSKVYLVYSQRYPKTAEQFNTAMERVTSRIGEKMYYISHSNCENLVIYALEGSSSSSQWRDAGVLRRAAGDVVEKILPAVVGNGTNFLLKKLDPNVPNLPPNKDSIDLSSPEDETKKRSINDPAAPNQKCSRLSIMLRAFKSCITGGNTKLAILFLLLKLLIFFMNLYLSPGGYSLVIIMAVIVRTLILFFGPRFLLLEIDKLHLMKFMSRADIFREVFKMIVVYFASMTGISCILTILETCVLCLYQLTCYILAGILFDAFIYPLFNFLLNL